MSEKDSHRYDDMLDMPHHQSVNHPHMSLYNRAAQFSPFAALTGYGDTIDETARLTEKKTELDEQTRQELDAKFQMILNELSQHPIPHSLYHFTYFIPDALKEGGSYRQISGIIKKVNLTERTITLYAANQLSDGQVLLIDQIRDIEGEAFQSSASSPPFPDN